MAFLILEQLAMMAYMEREMSIACADEVDSELQFTNYSNA